MVKPITIEGGKNVNIESLLSALLEESWMVEESWLETTIAMFHSCDTSAFVKVAESPSKTTATIVGSTAIIPVSGPIFSRPNFLTHFLGIGCVSGIISSDLQTLLNDDDIESIVLDIDSPGGVVTGTNQLASLIKEGTKTKPITAYVGGTGASAAYWLASGASEIVLDATARVGSIGVVAAVPVPHKDDGYVEIVNTSSPHKRPDASTDAGKKVITKELDALADVFISTVSANREVSTDVVKSDFGKGGIVVGQKAVDVGMADRLGSMDSILNKEFEESKGEASMKLDLDKLKADHKDVYDQVVAEVTESVTASVTGEFTPQMDAKDATIEKLEGELEEASAANDSMEGRMKKLEKADVMRTEKAIKGQADAIFTGKLGASDVPERLHGKVRSQVDYNKYVADGVLDDKAFGKAADDEIAEWETTLGESFIQSPGSGASDLESDDSEADDATVNRLLGHVQEVK